MVCPLDCLSSICSGWFVLSFMNLFVSFIGSFKYLFVCWFCYSIILLFIHSIISYFIHLFTSLQSIISNECYVVPFYGRIPTRFVSNSTSVTRQPSLLSMLCDQLPPLFPSLQHHPACMLSQIPQSDKLWTAGNLGDFVLSG